MNEPRPHPLARRGTVTAEFLVARLFLVFLGAALYGACAPSAGGGYSVGGPCTPGVSAPCACLGALGTQTCGPDGTFGACACENGDGGARQDGSTPASSGDGVNEDVSTPGGPSFLSAGTSTSSLTDGESVTFTAVLTDPDGIDDLIGGSLKSADGSTTYGAFQTSASEGSYALRLSWAEINDASGITFATDEPRRFVAEFFDVSGRRATRTLTVKLHCGGLAACSGSCVDLDAGLSSGKTTKHCGTCANHCAAGGACTQGKCVGFAACSLVTSSYTTCAARCASTGASCVNTCPGFGDDVRLFSVQVFGTLTICNATAGVGPGAARDPSYADSTLGGCSANLGALVAPDFNTPAVRCCCAK